MIHVTAGILLQGGHVLIAKRPAGKHLAGYWEFPGGKVEPGETPEMSLIREFMEEFGVSVEVGRSFHENVHAYPGKKIRLLSFLITHCSGAFEPNEHDEIRWVPLGDLLSYRLAPADVPVAVKLAAASGND